VDRTRWSFSHACSSRTLKHLSSFLFYFPVTPILQLQVP
jgi:hypothetical protein